MKQNHNMKKELVELLKRSDEPTTSFKTAIFNKGEPILHNGMNLLDLQPTDGPSSFGRLLAANVFGTEDKCILINQRLGARINRKNSRKRCCSELEKKFTGYCF